MLKTGTGRSVLRCSLRLPQRQPIARRRPLLVAVALLSALCSACGRVNFRAQRTACESLTVGMSETDVLRKMGGQHKRIELTGSQAGKHKILFEGPPAASANPQVVVNSSTNQVEAVFCGE